MCQRIIDNLRYDFISNIKINNSSTENIKTCISKPMFLPCPFKYVNPVNGAQVTLNVMVYNLDEAEILYSTISTK